VYVLGVTLCAALTACSRNFGDRGGPYFLASLTLAGVAYILAIRELFRGRGARATPTFPRRVVVIGLVLAAVWHAEFLRLPSGVDDDIHRYVWDGRLQRLGYNPYIVVPSDPAVKGLHTPETRNLNNPDLPSPYPAGAQLFFRAVTAIQESTFAFKVAFVVCEFAIILVLFDVLRCTRQGLHLVLAHRHCWSPIVGGVGRCDGAPKAGGCGRRTWAGYRGEIPARRTLASLLEAGSHSRRGAGGSRSRTPLRAISRSFIFQPWPRSDRLAGHVCAEFPL
jgi:hypothetical protein